LLKARYASFYLLHFGKNKKKQITAIFGSGNKYEKPEPLNRPVIIKIEPGSREKGIK